MHRDNPGTEAPDKHDLYIQIVLNEPLYEGNIGSTARVLKNFGFQDLVLVNPCPIGSEAWMLLADLRDLDLLYDPIEAVLCDLDYPEHKRRKTMLMTRRILGRAELGAREVYTLRGILRLIDYHNR